MFNTLDDLELATLQWSHDRGITVNGKAETQALKLGSELGELQDNIAKGKDIRDDIGDMLVVLTNLAKLKGTSLVECWNIAYNDIKDRKGFLNANGTFIKSTDDNYEELLAEFEGTKLPRITHLSANHLPSILTKYHIGVLFDNDESTEFYFTLNKKQSIPMNLPTLFIGKTEEQLSSYLKTIGIVEGTKIEDPKCVDIESHSDGEFTEVKFSDGTKEKIRFSDRFILEYPDPFVLTKSFMIENNEVLSEK